MTRIVFTVEIEAEKTSGKFASKDDLANELEENFYDPGTISVGDSEYEITSWEVSWT